MPVTEIEQTERSAGPKVQLDVIGDGHFEPDTVETVNLGIENFSGWQEASGQAIVSALSIIADREAVVYEYCGNERCADPQYIEGLTAYLALLKDGELLDRNLILSALRHGLNKDSGPELRVQVARLFEHADQGVREIACAYVQQLNADQRSFVSDEACQVIARSLSTAPERFQPALIALLRSSESQQNSQAVARAVTDVALSAGSDSVLQQAVLLAQNSTGAEVDKLMTRSFENSSGYACGVAAAYLLRKNPNDMQLREKVAAKMDELDYWVAPGISRGYALGPYCHGLLASKLPAAVALAMEHVDARVGMMYHGARPIAALVRMVNDWRAESQYERDLNTIKFHLSTGFQPDAAALAVATLVNSGSEHALKFLQNQLHNPPNSTRRAVLASALSAAFPST